MSRLKTTIQIVLVAATLLLAGGTSAEARRVTDVQVSAQVTRVAKKKSPSFWHWLKIRLTRYAMAAN